ncbi:MAG: prolipoprotein diacylglyceryl transferase [bacterium]|nr:prolipoprotein diacylglyceryl transferase [bacterium]
MFNFLHTFHPSPILFAIGPIQIHWYGFFIMAGALAAIAVAFFLAKKQNLKTDAIIDLAFWLIIFGLIGARLYHVFLELPYYLANPLNIFKIWQGGLAIHGGVIAGITTLWFYAKKHQHNFWQLASIITPGLALAQALGRWGNYFNQELFGYPTGLPWGIPIDAAHRPWQYFNYQYFHPTFLYESIGNLVIFLILIALHANLIKKSKTTSTKFPISLALPDPAEPDNFQFPIFVYLLLYSLLRFSTEFIRIDETPTALGLRFPQLASLLIIFAVFIYFIWLKIIKKPALDK